MRGSSFIRKLFEPPLSLFNLKVLWGYEYDDLMFTHSLKSITSQNVPNFVDLYMERKLSLVEEQGHIHIIQVGANDGVQNDFITKWYSDDRIRAILVEPQLGAFKRLESNFRSYQNISLLNTAISEDGRDLTLYCFEENTENGISVDVLSSFDRKHLENWKNRLNLKTNIVEKTFSSRSINQIIQDFSWISIDVLVIDVEGYDFHILKTLNQLKYLPDIVIYEHINLETLDKFASLKFMISLGYKIEWMQNDVLAVKDF